MRTIPLFYLSNPLVPMPRITLSIVGSFRVLMVLLMSDIPQIGDSVIQLVSVYVIYVLLRPSPKMVKPSETMSVAYNPINPYRQIPDLHDASSHFPNRDPDADSFFPYKNASVRVIRKNFS